MDENETRLQSVDRSQARAAERERERDVGGVKGLGSDAG